MAKLKSSKSSRNVLSKPGVSKKKPAKASPLAPQRGKKGAKKKITPARKKKKSSGPVLRNARVRAPSISVPVLVSLPAKPTKSRRVASVVKVLEKIPEVLATTSPCVSEKAPITYIDRGLPIPENYGFDRLVALVRDTKYIFCYWELHGRKIQEIREQRGQNFIDGCAWVLRIYRLNEGIADDTEIDPSVGNWYINVGCSGKYQFELALLSPDGEWITLLVSQIIETPLSGPSSVIDEEWRLRPEDEEAMAAHLGKALDLSDAEKRGVSGFLGSSRLQSSFALASSHTVPGSSASGRPVAGSWAMSFQGASGRVNSSGSGGFGWVLSPAGDHEPVLERPTHPRGGPNWNAQPDLPQETIGKTKQPHFKIKLPRRLKNLVPPTPTWPLARKRQSLSVNPLSP